ncbi:MAG: AraC family transcriptional regulator [Cyclobacteriaceae bacterium]
MVKWSLIIAFVGAVIAFNYYLLPSLQGNKGLKITIVFFAHSLPLLLVYIFFHDSPKTLLWLSAGVLVFNAIMVIHTLSQRKSVESNRSTTQVDKQELYQTFDNVHEWMLKERMFLTGTVKLSDVSKALRVSEKMISTSVNECAEENFNTYVNRLRIMEAQKMLQDESYDHWTIDGIAESVGFSNKVSFYRSFKKIVGCSPNEFKRNLQNN